MRICPQCNTPYPDDVAQCARDGMRLTTLADSLEERRPPTRELLGSIIGNYRIHTRLGSGGMGSVYQATHLSVGKEVAIKIIKEEEKQNPTLAERFFREARAVATINHENIVQLMDFGCTPEGRLYLVMELLLGQTLADLVQTEQILPPRRALSITTQICHGLAVAHQQKIVHRDLKPENIFLTTFRGDPDFVKILDFGISKEVEGKGLAHQSVTAPGGLLGTPLYMAPEQGTAVDHRSDIYSLGLILYRMVTGQVPFTSENLMDLLYKHITEKPRPPRALNPEVPPSLEAVILRALAKSKEERFASMEAFAEALESLPFSELSRATQRDAPPLALPSVTHQPSYSTQTTLSEGAGESFFVPNKKRSPLRLVAGALLFLGVGLLAVLFLLPPKSGAPGDLPAQDAASVLPNTPAPPATAPAPLPPKTPASQPITPEPPPAPETAPSVAAKEDKKPKRGKDRKPRAQTRKNPDKEQKKPSPEDRFLNKGDAGL